MDHEFANYKPQSRVLRDLRMNDDIKEVRPEDHSLSPEIIEEKKQGAGSHQLKPALK